MHLALLPVLRLQTQRALKSFQKVSRPLVSQRIGNSKVVVEKSLLRRQGLVGLGSRKLLEEGRLRLLCELSPVSLSLSLSLSRSLSSSQLSHESTALSLSLSLITLFFAIYLRSLVGALQLPGLLLDLLVHRLVVLLQLPGQLLL